MPIELAPANVETGDIIVPAAKRGRGRPKGSKNKTPQASIETSIDEEPIEPPRTPTSQLGTGTAIEDEPVEAIEAIEATDIVTETAETPKKARGRPKGIKNVKLKPDTPPPSHQPDLETDHDEPPMPPTPKEPRPQRRVAQVEYTPPTPPESPATRKRRVQSEYRLQQVALHTARRDRFSSLLDRFMT